MIRHFMQFVTCEDHREYWRCPFCGRAEEHDLWVGQATVIVDGDTSVEHRTLLRQAPQEREIELPAPFATWAERHGIR